MARWVMDSSGKDLEIAELQVTRFNPSRSFKGKTCVEKTDCFFADDLTPTRPANEQ